MAASMESLIVSLFETLSDKDDAVRDAVVSSLHTIGIHEPVRLLETGQAFFTSRHAKLSNAHRGTLLNVMRRICAETLNQIPDNLAALIVNLATQELTFSKDIVEDWQSAASGLLSVLCRRHCSVVVESLLQKFQPGSPPHPYVVHTLGDVAIANAQGFVPFLTDILSRTVPMLSGLKQEALRYAFVVAVKKYCESVQEYVANINNGANSPPNNNSDVTQFQKESFTNQFAAVYDVFYANWLHSKDQKTRGAIVECLGELCHLLSVEKMRDETKRLLPYMISLLKKNFDPLPVTLGLCRLLEASIVYEQSSVLESHLDDLWLVLFNHVNIDNDKVDASVARCQNEALRCYHVTATKYSDRLVYYLIQRLQSVTERARISALVILRHLVNSASVYIQDKKSLVIMALKPVLNDSSNKVKKWLCHLTLALGDHGYLDVEQGHLLVEFIIKQMSLSDDDKKTADSDYVSNKSLRMQSGQALYSLASNVRNAEHVLWPFLFEYLCVESHTIAVTDICRSLVPLAQRLNAENRLNIVYANANDRLPGPHQILARLLVCLGVPNMDQKQKRGLHILQLLKEMASFFFPALRSTWDHEMVNLMTTWEENAQQEKQDGNWESVVLKFISKTIDVVNDEEWICALAASLGKQFNLYANYLEEKRFLFKILGGVLAKIKNQQFVVDHLDLIFRSVNHANALERMGCAQGVGFCAGTHIDIVLTKLENVAKLEYQKKPTGFLGFIKESIPMKTENDFEIANLKATIMLAYGYVTFYCPIKIVVQKLESIILRFLASYFQNSKDTVVKQSLISTIDLIATTVHSNHLMTDYKCTFRSDMINHIKEYVKSEPADPMTSSIRILGMNAVSSLAKLDPYLTESEMWNVITLFGHYIYSVQTVKCEQEDDTEVSIQNGLNSFNSMLSVLLLKQATAERLTLLLKLVQPWFSSELAVERERSIDSACHLLKVYYTSAEIVLGHATEFSLMGSLLGRFCPRFGDSVTHIRQKALDCVHWLLAVSVAHMGHGTDYHDSVVDSILEYKENLEKSDLIAHLSIINHLSKVIDQRLPGKQIQNYLSVLFDLVLDKQVGVSAAAATLLRLQLIVKGEQLISEAEKIISVLLQRLSALPGNLQPYAECLQALHEFAKHHLHLTLSLLLQQPLPYSQSVCDCWASLSRDHQLLPAILDYLLEILIQEAPYETMDSSNVRYARCLPLAATAALSIVCLHLPESSHQQWFPRLLVRLLIQSGCFAEVTLPRNNQLSLEFHKYHTPASVVRESVRSLLVRHPISYSLDERTWTDFDDPAHYSDATSSIAKAIGVDAPELIEPVVHLLKEYQSSKIDGARVVCVAVFSSFVKFCQQQSEELVDLIVATLMAGLADSSLAVRKISVRGMGYIAHCSDNIFERYTQTVLSAMMAGLEDPTDHKDEVALEAMQGLGRLTTRISKDHISKIMVYIMLRIRPCFEKGSGAVRAVAFSLFGNLARFECHETYVEQIHSNIVSLILHLNDELDEVRMACAFVFMSIAPYMKNTEAEYESFQALLKSSPNPNGGGDDADFSKMTNFDYNYFLKEFTKFLVTYYIGRVNFYALSCANYLKSSSIRIRCNSALFIGFLLGAVPQEQRTTISKDLIFSGLALLLKEPEPEVRLNAAEAVAYLHGY